TFKYYLSHFLNTYAKSKIVGYDAIYVYLVDNYYSKGKAPWVEEENLLKLEDNANKVRPVLIGKQGPDITVYDEMNNPISISDIEYEYLVLLFWSPDCGHCKKTMPDFIEFDKKWRDRGVRTFAICSKHQEKVKDCWEYVKEKDMLGFINAADEFHRSRFKLKYNVQSTPKVFILDKNREILMKNVGGDQLDRVMEELLKRENEKE
ncbi:MAG: TlpA family protein disulfide reductase, partial [Bacteroidia bacterium]|nr:TlpA family protein disulfide reductase [Bacteroidia bacterium]